MKESINRRNFIRCSAAATLGLGLSGTFGFDASAAIAGGDLIKLTILHTNDVHSRVEPFPLDGSKYAGLGGTARRAALLARIRSEEENVLLLDAGDIFQGTPYFNKFGGELEIKLMSMMGYDAATMGNHDFDNGLEGFLKQLPHAKFPILCANYDFSNTLLKGSTKPYQIFKKGGLKIGVFGIGLELKGLVADANYGDTLYLDPVKTANEIAALLKHDFNCDLVICLSHLGYQYDYDKISDQTLAKNTSNIDLIIGGHTHTFMDQPEDIRNLGGGITTINQVGFAGINLGRVDYYFEKYKGRRVKTGLPYLITNELE